MHINPLARITTKFILFFSIWLLLPAKTKAQEEVLIPRPGGYALGIGVGLANVWGDLNKHIPTLGERVGIARHITQSLMVGVEYYGGTLSSEETPNSWTTGLKSTSKFYSLDLNAKVNMSVLFSNTESEVSRLLSGFFFGSGIGYISCNVTQITETLNTNKPLDTSLRNCIRKQDAQLYIPLNLGYRYQLGNFLGITRPSLMLNLNMCYTYSDYIDGYNLSAVAKSNKNNRFTDVFSMITIGFSIPLTGEGERNALSTKQRQKQTNKSTKPLPEEKKKEDQPATDFKMKILD
jgi:hypothetical protein